MPLLDRERELELLSEGLERAATGQGGVALVTGEAGIGKTSLVREFLSTLDPEFRVLRGACEDLNVAEPLGPLRDILRDADPSLVSELSGIENHLEIYAQVLSVLANHPDGTVVVIEDMHWADEATVDFVRFVARRIIDRPIFLMVTSRAEQAYYRQKVRRAFGDLPTEALFRIGLAPLSEDAVSELCKNLSRDPKDIYHASGGNAFFVTELLRNAGDDIPPSIRDAVLSRVDSLSSHERALLEAVSIVPRRAEARYLEVVLGDSIDLYKAIEACMDAGLLFTDGDNLFFQHEIAREAVASSLSEIKRRALHRKFLDVLMETEEAGLSRLLHHAQGAADSEAVAKLAPRAAEAAAGLGSRREAAEFYILAVEALGDQSDADILEKTAAACYLGLNHSMSVGYQTRALELIEQTGDAVRRGDALRKLSRYRWIRSDFTGAFEAIHKAIETLSDHRGPELAQAYSSLSQLLMTGFYHDEVEEPATKAIELAEEFERPDIMSHALNNLGMSKQHRDPEKGRELLTRSIEIGRDLEDPDHSARAMGNWMHFEFHQCEFEKALERAKLSVDHNLKNEMDAYYRYSLGMVARVNLELGHWDEVKEIASRGFDPDDRVPESYNFNGGMALLVHQVRSGSSPDWDVEEYLSLFDHEASEAQRIGPIAEIIVERDWMAGKELTSAIKRLHSVAAMPVDGASIGGVRVWLKRLGEAVPEADFSNYPKPQRLELQRNIADAAQAWADLKAPYQQALCLAFGDAEQRSKALEMFECLGAAPAVQKLRELTGTPLQSKRGRPAASGPYGLTNRQIDVLRLLGEGMTNTQIGETLFISPKTVDHHVSAILARLGASSRGEAAAIARKLDLI